MKSIELTLGETNNYFIREAFNTLRTNILFSGKDIKVILVTSCVAHEGKTTVSFEMSKSLAESHKKVLFVDADLRKSVTVSRYTKERGINGLSQILSGQIDLNQSIYRTQIEGLDMIFAGPFPPNPTELVGSPVFKELLDCVRDAYDYIIIDAPPLGLVIDAAVMASVCDGALLVINQGGIKYRAAQNVKAQLAKSGCRILGVVLNQTQRKKHSIRGSRDAYYSRYSYSYGEYYQANGASRSDAVSHTPRKIADAAGNTRPAPPRPSPSVGASSRSAQQAGGVRPALGVSRTEQRTPNRQAPKGYGQK